MHEVERTDPASDQVDQTPARRGKAGSLLRRTFLIALVLVSGGLITSSAVELFFRYRESVEAIWSLPRIVSAAGHTFSDMPARCLHIVNLATVRELERVAGRPVDPLRFRANVYVDGVEPWAESAWLGRDLGIGGARLSVFHRTQRCEATNVDPVSGARDMAIPAMLQRT